MDIKNKNISILVVDDEEMIVTILLNFLGEKGYQVTGINEPGEAIELVKTNSFDIVFTDLMMPGINGMELVKEIRRQGADTQIIIFTGYASVESAIDAVRQGVYDYIKKPFRLEDIESVLLHALEKQLLQRENRILNQKIKRMLTQVTMLYDISNIIYQVREKKYAVEMLFDTLAESMKINTAYIYERKKSGTSFKMSYAGVGSSEIKGLSKFSSESVFNGSTLMVDEPTVLDCIGKELELDNETIELPEECRRMILVPIKYQGILEGYLIIVEHKDHRYPFEDELTLLRILATQIAPIIGSQGKHSSDILQAKQLEPDRALQNLIKAELALSDHTNTPVSFAMARLVASGDTEDDSDFALIRESWRNVIAGQLGRGKRLHWAGIDTLLIMAVGGNPVGLEHHMASVRNELETGKMAKKTKTNLSMAYSILTYPFDVDSAKKLSIKLSSRLFYDASEIKFNQ